MTTKTKAAKPAIVNNIIAKPELIALAKLAGQSALGTQTMRDKCNEACKALHKAKAKIGHATKCELAKAFLAERFAGKAAKAGSKTVILSAFRKAVESGKDYNENASKAKKKAVTKQDAPKASDAVETDEAEPVEAAKPVVVQKQPKDDDTTIILALPRKAKAKDAAKKMRAFVEKMRQSEELAPLAAYIVDVLDEFDGTAEQF
jgi:hypothetical protein